MYNNICDFGTPPTLILYICQTETVSSQIWKCEGME